MKILQNSNAKTSLILFQKGLEKNLGTYLPDTCTFLDKYPQSYPHPSTLSSINFQATLLKQCEVCAYKGYLMIYKW